MSHTARILRSPVGWAILLVFVVLIAASMITIVPETQQALIVRLGVPQPGIVNLYRPNERFGETGAGLIAHLPLVEQVAFIDKREQNLELTSQPILSSDQQRLQVDAYARYRIVDPLRMYLAVGGDQRRLVDALQPRFGSALRAALGRLSFAELIAPQHGPALADVRAALDEIARQYGARIVDVRLDGAALPDGAPLQSVYDRMKADRAQQAMTIRGEGLKQASQIRADADAAASRLYADSYGQDSEFYDFYRAMQSYRVVFGVDQPTDGSTTMVISPNSEYFRQFRGGGGK